jgi:hypothetical protein
MRQWLKRMFNPDVPAPSYQEVHGKPTLDDWAKFLENRPKMPDPEMQLKMARNARIHRQQAFFEMNKRLKQLPEMRQERVVRALLHEAGIHPTSRSLRRIMRILRLARRRSW